MDNQTLYDLKNSFLAEWPLSRIKKMSIENYTNLDKTSFPGVKVILIVF